MKTHDAILQLRRDPVYASLIRDTYIDQDVRQAAERFLASAEFAETLKILGPRLRGAQVLDLGAGNGIATYALAKSGAGHVYAVEPDPSDAIGSAAIRGIVSGLPVTVMDGMGDRIPVPDASIDILFVRQVLHHIYELPAAMKEFARVVKPGGLFIATREHVVDDDEQMRQFLTAHPVHQLTEGEHAHSLAEYTGAMRGAGFKLVRVIEPWDSVINAFPAVRTEAERARHPRTVLARRWGSAGSALGLIPGVSTLVWKHIRRPLPGRMYSFVAEKPGPGAAS